MQHGVKACWKSHGRPSLCPCPSLRYLLHAAKSFWEANRFSASQNIPRISWNPKVHYLVDKWPPPVPVLSHINSVHAPPPPSHFLKIHLNIILPSRPTSSKWSLPLKFPHQYPLYISALPHTCYMLHPSHSSRFNHPNNTGWGVQTIKLLIM
jgi:hypothetical protein